MSTGQLVTMVVNKILTKLKWGTQSFIHLFQTPHTKIKNQALNSFNHYGRGVF